MKEKKRSQDGEEKVPDSVAEERTFSKRWLRKFLAGLAITFAALALTMWLYTLWGHLAVAKPAAKQLASEDPAVYSQAVRTLETPHIFSGYDPYHGFGTEAGERRFQSTRAILAKSQAYSEREKSHLIQGIAFYIPAFIESKLEGETPVVDGDKEVIASLYSRWENALASGMALAIHFTIAALVLGSLLFLYWKLNLFSRFE